MKVFWFSLLAMFVLVGSASGQVCKVDDRYLAIDVQRNQVSSEFTFELVYVLCKNGETLKVEQLKKEAPYKTRVSGGVGYLAIRGVTGAGKIIIKYKTSSEEKESMQYVAANELVAVSWMPLGATGTPGTFWTSHKPKGAPSWSELSVYSATNKPQ